MKLHISKYICNHENNVPSRLSPQWLEHALGHDVPKSCIIWPSS